MSKSRVALRFFCLAVVLVCGTALFHTIWWQAAKQHSELHVLCGKKPGALLSARWKLEGLPRVYDIDPLGTHVSVDFPSKPFIECLRELKEKARVTFAVDNKLPEGALRHPVTLKLEDVRARDVLDRLVELVGAGYAVKGRVVLVTSREEAFHESLVFRHYDVRHLTMLVQDFPGPGGLFLRRRDEGDCVVIETEEEEEEHITASSLAEMILARVAPDSWQQESGAIIEERGGCLVVWQTPEAHAEIERALAELSSRVKRMIEVEVVVIRLDPPPEKPLARLIDGATAVDLMKKGEIVSRASTICFNGEKDEIFAAEQVRFVAGFQKAEHTYDPNVRYLCHGLSAKVRPVCGEGSDAVSLDLEIHWAQLDGFKEKAIGRSKFGEMRVQEPDVRNKILRTTVHTRAAHWTALELGGERGMLVLARARPLEAR